MDCINLEHFFDGDGQSALSRYYITNRIASGISRRQSVAKSRFNECKWVVTDSILSLLQVERDDYFGEEIVWIWESNWGLNAHPSGQDAVLHQFLRGEELPGSALQTKTGIFKVSSMSSYFITIMVFHTNISYKISNAIYCEPEDKKLKLQNTSIMLDPLGLMKELECWLGWGCCCKDYVQ